MAISKESQKPKVIERVYETLVDPVSGELTRSVVTNNDISQAIEWCNTNLGNTLSKNNPANFIKDVIRGPNANRMWPESLKAKKVTARQVTGKGNVFQFIPYALGQLDAFPDRFGYHPEVLRHKVQTVSFPLATKALGRNDETYLIQVAAKLAVVETHFALYSPIRVLELHHLQIGIKLRLCEVDSLYSAKYKNADGIVRDMIITAEAKKRGQRILEEQVIQQMRAAFGETPVDLVVPIAMTAADKGIYVAEFKAVRRQDIDQFGELELASEMLYELVPAVKGI
jgi:hypothetical protein